MPAAYLQQCYPVTPVGDAAVRQFDGLLATGFDA